MYHAVPHCGTHERLKLGEDLLEKISWMKLLFYGVWELNSSLDFIYFEEFETHKLRTFSFFAVEF
jgi:hypothetical protein